jgi:hypothetical protein
MEEQEETGNTKKIAEAYGIQPADVPKESANKWFNAKAVATARKVNKQQKARYLI